MINHIRINYSNLFFNSFSKKRIINKKTPEVFNNLFNYNFNLILFTILSKRRKHIIFKNLNLSRNKFFPKLYTTFLSNFVEKLTKQKCLIKLVTNLKLKKSEKILVNYFFKKFFFLQRQFKGVLHLNEFIYIILVAFKYKDLFFLKS